MAKSNTKKSKNLKSSLLVITVCFICGINVVSGWFVAVYKQEVMKKLGVALLIILFCGASATVMAQAKGYREIYEGYLWKNGRLLQVRAGRPIPAKEPVKLKNGFVLYPEGYSLSLQGVRNNLREGESVDINGKVLYPEYRPDGTIAFLSSRPVNNKKNNALPAPQPPANLKIKKSKN